MLVAAARDKLKEKSLPAVDETAVVEDVKRIRNHLLVPKLIPVYGYLYDVKTGKSEVQVVAASPRPPSLVLGGRVRRWRHAGAL